MIDAVRLAVALCAGIAACVAPVPCLGDEWPRVVFLRQCAFGIGTSFTKWSKGQVLPFVPSGAYIFKFPGELAAWIDVYSGRGSNFYLKNKSEKDRIAEERYNNFMDNEKILILKKDINVVPLEDMIFGSCEGQLQGLVRHPEYGDVYLVRLGLF